MTIWRVGPKRTFKTINDAYLVSNAYDVLWVDEGIYEEKLIFTKPVHLIGNTACPGNGGVIMRPPLSENALYFLDIVSETTIYIENMYLCLNSDASSSNETELIEVLNCQDTNIIFNRCILDSSTWSYVFDCNNSLNSMSLYNCRVIWRDDFEFGTSGASHFERASWLMPYIIDKCIFSNTIENITDSTFTQQLPYNYLDNEASIENTTYSSTGIDPIVMTDYDHMFDSYYDGGSVSRAIWEPSTLSTDLLSLTTDFGEGEEKKIKYFRIEAYTSYSVYMTHVRLYASNDGEEWTKLYGRIENTYFISSRLDGDMAYRYYKLTIYKRAYNSHKLMTEDYCLATANPDYIPFDYTLDNNKVNYGPHYGEEKLPMPTQYYFEGTVTDVLSENKKLDTITFDPYNKSTKIFLSLGNSHALLSASNKKQYHSVLATLGRRTGKWYWEVKSYDYIGLQKGRVGVGLESSYLYDFVGGVDDKSIGYEMTSGDFYKGGVVVKTGATTNRGEIVGIALDLDNGKIWWSSNGVWLLDGDPALGLNPVFDDIGNTLFPMVSLYSSGHFTAEAAIIFGPDKLTYEIPNGFEFYSTSTLWKIKDFNQSTNELLSYTYSDPIDSSYYIETTYSGAHFLICEDADSSPNYNDLIYSNLIPKEII